MITEKKEKQILMLSFLSELLFAIVEVANLSSAIKIVNEKMQEKFQECTCELILVP